MEALTQDIVNDEAEIINEEVSTQLPTESTAKEEGDGSMTLQKGKVDKKTTKRKKKKPTRTTKEIDIKKDDVVEVVDHMPKTKDFDIKKDDVSVDRKPVEEVKEEKESVRTVCGCNIQFENRKKKMLHNRVVHKNYFLCETCSKTYKESEDYQMHIQKHAKKIKNNSNICDECGFIAVNKYNLKGHKDLRHDNQMFICDICCREFRGKLKLKIHRRRFHRNSEQCEECSGIFKNLAKHKKTIHTKESEKKYQCDHCEKGFIDKNRRDVHVQSVHMKKKPYICRYDCGYACADGGNRLKHEKLHHGQQGFKIEQVHDTNMFLKTPDLFL